MADEAAVRLRALEKAAREASSLRDCEKVKQGIEALTEVPDSYKHSRIAVLRNFTIEPWVPAIAASLFADRIASRFWIGDFDVFEEYLERSSPLLEFRPDFILLAFESRMLFRDLYHAAPWDKSAGLAAFPEHFISRLQNIVSSIEKLSPARIIIMNPASPSSDYFQPFSHQVSTSLISAIRKINCLLPAFAEKNGNVSIFDVDHACACFGIEKSFDRNMWYFAANPFAVEFIIKTSKSLGKLIGLFHHPRKKCIVLDLDNTLWGGILGEDGEAGLKIGTTYPGAVYREFQMFLKGLRQQGILLAANSKNNEADCLEFLRSSPDMILRETDFAAVRINWNDKIDNMKEIAKELSLGLDSFIFIDDSPYECELMKTFLPEVSVYQMPAAPMEIPLFISEISGIQSIKVLDEDRKRSEYYLAEKQRKSFEKQFQNAREFLKRLNIELSVEPVNERDVQRVAQLTQKTNQFNLTTKRYMESDIQEFCKKGYKIFTLRMKDVFGDYGLVGVAILKPGTEGCWLFDTLLLSCRVLGRSVEYAFVDYCLREAKKCGGRQVVGEYIKTQKNEQVKDIFPKFNFRMLKTDDTSGSYVFDLYDDQFVGIPEHIILNAGGVDDG